VPQTPRTEAIGGVIYRETTETFGLAGLPPLFFKVDIKFLNDIIGQTLGGGIDREGGPNRFEKSLPYRC
jgi:hypothetical protein